MPLMTQTNPDSPTIPAPDADQYDLFDPDYVRDPAVHWARFRAGCPVARSSRYGGSWMPVRHADVVSVAKDIGTFTSAEGVSVIEVLDRKQALSEGNPPIDFGWRREWDRHLWR